MPRKPKPPTCEDCYFRKNMLCALELDEPCTTFRPNRPEGLVPPRQPVLLMRPPRWASAVSGCVGAVGRGSLRRMPSARLRRVQSKCPLRGPRISPRCRGRHRRSDPRPSLTKPLGAPLLSAAGELNTLRLRAADFVSS